MNIHIKTLISLISVWIMTFDALALPKYAATRLPLPQASLIDPEDGLLVKEVAALNVHQDDKDPDQFYYVPPFHVTQYAEGAATMVPNVWLIKHHTDAKAAIDARNLSAATYTHERLHKLEERILKSEENCKYARLKLNEAMLGGNADIIKLWQDNLTEETETHKNNKKKLEDAEVTIETTGSLWPDALKKAHNEHIIMQIADAGLNVPYTGKEDPDVMFENIQNTMENFSKEYGGFMSMNIYAGFTMAQLNALKAYKTKHFPNIKVALMPVEKMTFTPLTEMLPQSKNRAAVFFRQMKGAGNYLGSTITFDATLAGTASLVRHLGPFVLPIGISYTFKQALEPAEAELNCDFSIGYKIEGRADVRDGLIIYDNDITDTISGRDHSEGGCNLVHISGNIASAQFKAMEALKKRLDEIFVYRTMLAQSEKEAYLASIKKDVQNNRRLDEPTYTHILENFTGTTVGTFIIERLTRAADFHWHTSIYNKENLSTLKFSEKISIKGYETLTNDMPVNLCLVFNTARNAYDACLTLEEKQATSMSQSAREAESSPACAETTNPMECGQKRTAAGFLPNRVFVDDPDNGYLVKKL